MEMFSPGRYVGKISEIELRMVGENETPLVEIKFDVKGFENLVRHNLWLTEKKISGGKNEGSTVVEVSMNNLIRLGYVGKSLSQMNHPNSDIVSLFTDINRAFELEITEQSDKDGKLSGYPEVRYVVFENPKLDFETTVKRFGNLDSQFSEIASGNEELPF